MEYRGNGKQHMMSETSWVHHSMCMGMKWHWRQHGHTIGNECHHHISPGCVRDHHNHHHISAGANDSRKKPGTVMVLDPESRDRPSALSREASLSKERIWKRCNSSDFWSFDPTSGSQESQLSFISCLWHWWIPQILKMSLLLILN